MITIKILCTIIVPYSWSEAGTTQNWLYSSTASSIETRRWALSQFTIIILFFVFYSGSHFAGTCFLHSSSTSRYYNRHGIVLDVLCVHILSAEEYSFKIRLNEQCAHKNLLQLLPSADADVQKNSIKALSLLTQQHQVRRMLAEEKGRPTPDQHTKIIATNYTSLSWM